MAAEDRHQECAQDSRPSQEGEENRRMQENQTSATGAVEKPAEGKAPVKFSFAVNSKTAASGRPPPPLFADSTKNPKEEAEVEYVTEFDGKGRKSNVSTKVIPKIENSWRPEKRMKNIMMESDPMASTEERFESETLTSGSQPAVQYGLVKRKLPNPADPDSTDNGAVNDHQKPQLSVQERELQRFRDDVDALPEETSMESYQNVPIEEFGEALLRGMGWEKGKPIGRNCTVVVEPFENARRVGKEGLGAIPAPKPEKVKKYIKPGETRQSKPTVGRLMCVVSGEHAGLKGQIAEIRDNSYTIAFLEGSKRAVLRLDQLAEIDSVEAEKAINKLKSLQIKGTQNGQRMPQTKHSRDVDYMNVDDRSDRLTRERSNEKTNGSSSERRHKDHDDERRKREERSRRRDDDYGHRTKDDWHKIKGEDRNDDRIKKVVGDHRKNADDRKREKERDAMDSIGSGRVRDKSSGGKSREDEILTTGSHRVSSSWLARDIRVKIVHKDAYGRRWYLQKGFVVNVISPLLCDIQMDEGGKVIQQVKQEHLETALPKRGGRVMILGGKYRGQVGRLQERVSEESVGHVQMDDSYDLLTFNLDDLAEYVGTSNDMDG